MNQRVLRTGNAVARGAATPATPAPRVAQRKPVMRNEIGRAEVKTETKIQQKIVNESQHSRSIATPDYEGEALGTVQIGHGKTIPLEQFAFVRIDVHVTLPCTADNVQSIAEEAHNHVVEIMAAEEDYLLGTSAPTRQAQRRGR